MFALGASSGLGGGQGTGDSQRCGGPTNDDVIVTDDDIAEFNAGGSTGWVETGDGQHNKLCAGHDRQVVADAYQHGRGLGTTEHQAGIAGQATAGVAARSA